MSETWTGTFESDIAEKRPVNDHVQNVLQFMQNHEKSLHELENSTKESYVDVTDHHIKPIKFAIEPVERVLPQDLLSSTTAEPFNKICTVLIFLCDEISQLKDIVETKFFRPILMFGQYPPAIQGQTNLPLSKEKMMGKVLPFLQELSNFVDRCYAVTVNLIQQLASLINSKETLYRITFNHTHLLTVFYSLADMMYILMALDTIIQQNAQLKESWNSYKSIVSYVRADPTTFDSTPANVENFERVLVAIDQSIMLGEIFRGCIEQNFETALDEETGNEIHVSIRGNQAFVNGEYIHCLKYMVETAVTIVGTTAELSERRIIMGCYGLYALYRRLLPPNQPPDSKLHKVMWGIQKTVPCVVVSDGALWLAGEFLLRNAPFDTLKKLDPPHPEAYRTTYLQQFDQQLNSKATMLSAQCKAWMVLSESRLQASFRYEPQPNQLLELCANIALKGLSLATRANFLIKICLVMHSHMNIPLTKSNLNDIDLLVETLKAIEYCFARKDRVIAEKLISVSHNIGSAILSITTPIRQRLESGKRREGSHVIEYVAINSLEDIIRSTDNFSISRQLTLSILIDVVSFASGCGEKDAAKLKTLASKLIAIANIAKDINVVCDTAIMFSYIHFLPTLVQSIYQNPTECNRLHYLFRGYEDGIKLCEIIQHTDATPFLLNYRSLLKEALRTCIIEPLCSDIENDLRLHIHTKHLDHMQALNPKTENLKPLRPFLDLSPIRILGMVIDIKNEVSHYLDLTFYNLTTVALHDWRTYSDMRSLAFEKLGLKLMDNFLPMGSLDQGLDVLQIMRNIHVFVSRFTYNMNMQQFVEFRPEKASKHLNTIRIQSIAASIRQHGLGVLNTTVNFTYQFLSSKFHIFSQFLFDEYIRAHLSREHRWFRKHKNDPAINNMYPYERALSFAKEIRKLGVNESGKSYLDQFRILISEIGNALGYVRMVRSASMYYCSEAVKFLPEFEDIISFGGYAGEGIKEKRYPNEADSPMDLLPNTGAKLSEETVRAAENLDESISTLVKNFGEGSDYFKVLVNVFQSVLLADDQDHLKYFYIIVPALCISWIDASLSAKDSMYKSSRGVFKEMYFTDDGFAMGIAYCLAILKQSRKYEAIHWIESVNHKIKVDSKDLQVKQKERALKEAAMKEKESKKKSSFFGFGGKSKSKEEEVDIENAYNDQDEVHSLQLTSKRLEAYRRETTQLFYSMSGAEIFFRRTDVDT